MRAAGRRLLAVLVLGAGVLAYLRLREARERAALPPGPVPLALDPGAVAGPVSEPAAADTPVAVAPPDLPPPPPSPAAPPAGPESPPAPAQPRPRRRRRRLVLLAVLLVALAAGGAALGWVLHVRSASRDVVGSSTVDFVTTDIPPAATATAPPPAATTAPAAGTTAPAKPVLPPVVWPTYGHDNRRLRSVPGGPLPPLRSVWAFRAFSLLEFPPSLAYGRLTVASNHGKLFSIDAATGTVKWTYDSGRCAAASPAVAGRVVFMAFLNKPPCNASGSGLDGEVVALDALTGKLRWRAVTGPTESSPLVANGLVTVGDWTGKVIALDQKTGSVVWTYQTGGKVKGAAALADGRLVVGSYDSHVYALDAVTSKLLWRASAQDRLGGRGTFYATPALAYGRAYIGSTDGKVYSFSASSGELRWSRSTGGYVYASAAVWNQLVLVGSYSGSFVALDAATGEERWRFRANGPISGSAAVIGGVVYVSTLRSRTYALDARTGKLLWEFPDGKYAAAIADPASGRVYLVGHARLFAMVPRR